MARLDHDRNSTQLPYYSSLEMNDFRSEPDGCRVSAGGGGVHQHRPLQETSRHFRQTPLDQPQGRAEIRQDIFVFSIFVILLAV